jgi:hypothetical protein
MLGGLALSLHERPFGGLLSPLPRTSGLAQLKHQHPGAVAY